MSAVGVTVRTGAVSPTTMARITGVVYLVYFVTAILGEVFTRQAGISTISALPGDAVAVAHGILSHETAYRVGWALGLVSTLLYVGVVSLFYALLRPVSRSLAFVATAFGLIGQALTALGSLFPLVPLAVLGGDSYLRVFDTQQLQSLALLSLNVSTQLGDIALVFAGPFQILIGYLIFRSTYLPRVLGVLVALAGLGWLLFLWPPLAHAVLTPLEALGFLGEVPLMLWLLIMGVNTQRWNEQVGAASASGDK